MTNYVTGSKRVHATGPSDEIRSAIREYIEFDASKDPTLAIELLKCASDLCCELALRVEEHQQGKMTPDHFATILSKHRKVAIAGGPKTGKSTLADSGNRVVYHTDDSVAAWDDVPQVVNEWLDQHGIWVVEGVQVGRCLRKGLKPDVVIYLKTAHTSLSKGQESMAKGCRTIYEEWLDMVQRTEQFDSVDMHDDYEVVTLRWNDNDE